MGISGIIHLIIESNEPDPISMLLTVDISTFKGDSNMNMKIHPIVDCGL